MINYLKSVFYDFLSTEKRGLFFLWVPVFLGVGIALYFGMTIEPPLYITFTCLFISGVTTYYLRNNYFVFLSTLIITIVFVGFISAQIRTHYLDVNLLPYSHGPAGIQGRIVDIELTQKGKRIVLDNLQISRLRADHVPTRIRLHVTKQKEGLESGQWIETWGKLKPVPQPTSPGAFDLQRHLYYKQIGALGFSLSEIKILDPPNVLPLSFQTFFEGLREKIIYRIDQAFIENTNEDAKALAKTFLTGNKKFINEETHEDIRASGLAHLLAISGLHIGLVSMLCFLTVRQLLSAIPAIALWYPIKKWAAVIAIFGALFYTLLTGASIPTLRAFIMCAFAFGAILIDRKAISLRSVAIAAIFILLIFPESLLSASFQLSFAAVTALVAYYERARSYAQNYKIFHYFKEIFKTSLIAGLATMPFAAYHFQRVAIWGLGSNLIAIPVTVFWIMPFGMLSLLLMPIGLEKIPLNIMGWGISSLVWVAEQTANLPYALLHTGTTPLTAFLSITIAGLVLCLIPHKIRFTGLVGIPLAIGIYFTTPDAIMKISSDAKLLGIKAENGELAFSNIRSAKFIREKWYDEWGIDKGKPKSFQDQFPCDQYGCTLTGPNKIKISFTQNPLSLWEDCKKSDIIISTIVVPEKCQGPLLMIDLQDLHENGAHALYKSGSSYYFDTVRNHRGTRPWTNYGQ